MQTWFCRDIKSIISLLCPKRMQSFRQHTHTWMPKVWWSLANMHDGLNPKHSQVGGQQEEEETARHFNKPPLPSKHLFLLSIPASKLPIPFPLHPLHPYPSQPLSPHIHTPHTHYPTKCLFSGPHAGQMFLMSLMLAAHQQDATNPVTFSAINSQLGAHTSREKEGKEEGKGKRST